MKAILSILLIVISVSAFAQSNDFTYVDAANGVPVPDGTGQVGDGAGSSSTGGVTLFADLASFQAAAPAAVNSEDIEDNAAAGAMVTTCAEPVNSASNDVCFTPGQFVDGLSVTTSSGGGVVLLDGGFMGLTSAVLGALTFADTTFMTFSGSDNQAIAMDVFAGLGASDVMLTFRDSGGATIGTATVPGIGVLPDNAFVGVITDVPFAEIEIESLGGNGELFDNVIFGPLPDPLPPAPAIPTLQTSGLILLMLLIAAVGVVLVSRRQAHS